VQIKACTIRETVLCPKPAWIPASALGCQWASKPIARRDSELRANDASEAVVVLRLHWKQSTCYMRATRGMRCHVNIVFWKGTLGNERVTEIGDGHGHGSKTGKNVKGWK
jgi:hypothetical protein